MISLVKMKCKTKTSSTLLVVCIVCVFYYFLVSFSFLTHSLYIYTQSVCMYLCWTWWVGSSILLLNRSLSVFLALSNCCTYSSQALLIKVYSCFFYIWITWFFLILICLTWVFIWDSWFLCSNLGYLCIKLLSLI